MDSKSLRQPLLGGDISDTSEPRMETKDTTPLANGINGDPTNPKIIRSFSSKTRQGLTLAWNNVKVTVPESVTGCLPGRRKVTPEKRIIKGASGKVRPGEVLAILGGSGSGKTSLLNAFTKRDLNGLDVSGTVALNNQDVGDDINFFSGYVQQEDVFLGSLTVIEYMWFSAMLRMSPEYGDEDRLQRIDDVLLELGLIDRKNVIIGNPGFTKGISGGEKKRLAFAAELLRNPMLLFADEPTSGLDSFSAQNVAETLQGLANRGRTILCTIHQPSSIVYAMFPLVMYLRDGEVVFFGGNEEMTKYLGSLGYHIPAGYNPADFAVQTVAMLPADHVIRTEVEELRRIKRHVSSNRELELEATYQATFWTQLRWILWLNFRPFLNGPGAWIKKLIPNVLFGVFIGLLWFQQPLDQLGLNNINGALFITTTQLAFNDALSGAADVSKNIAVFTKEIKSKMYSPVAFYLAKVIYQLPLDILDTFLYSTIIYWLMGLYPSITSFLYFFAALLMLGLNTKAIGQLCGALAPNPETAGSIAPGFLGGFLLLSGGLVSDVGLVPLFYIFVYTSPFYYSYRAIITIQWQDVDLIDCGPNYIPGDPCLRTGAAVLQRYGYEPSFLPVCVLVPLATYLAFIALGFLAIRSKAKKL